MTQEEKQLLLRDICARVHCGVMVKAQYKDGEGWKIEDRKLLGIYEDGQVYVDCVYTNIENVKPYLRPLLSMTKEERNNLGDILPCSMSFSYLTSGELIIYTDPEYDSDHYF